MIVILGCGQDSSPADGPGGRGFHGPWGFLPWVAGMARRWSGVVWQGSDPGPGGGDGIGPGPGRGAFQPAAPAAAGEPGGGVQHTVAESFGFGFSEVAAEGEQPEPGQQGRGDQGSR